MYSERFAVLRPLLVSLGLLAFPAFSRAAATMELYGTLSSMGVIVSFSAGEDGNRNAVAALSWRPHGSGDFRPGLPLSRVSASRFVGSLFFLDPGTSYDVRVTFSDPDGAPLDGTSLSGTWSTRAEPTVPSPSRSYYASNGGSGTACSFASPCALQTALSLAQAGQEVVLRAGVYRQGDLIVTSSGSAGAPIVIRGEAGAILDGSDPAPITWTAEGGGVYGATVNASDTHLVLADGQRLYPYGSLADLRSLRWQVPGFYASGTTVHVYLAGGANPASHAMLVSRYNTAVTVASQHHLVFQDLTFRYYGRGDYAKALYLDGASDVLVQRCAFTVNDLGIGLKRACDRDVFQDNTFSDTDFDFPWEAVKSGANLETGGIRMYDPMTGRGTVIRRNTFHDYFDGFGVCPEATAGVTNETDVHDNLVFNTGDDGMETDGRCSNVRIWGNTFHDVLSGVSLAPVVDGPVYAIRNVIYRTGSGNSDNSGLSFKFNVDGDASGEIFLFHNTVDAVTPGTSALVIFEPGSWKMIHARNNVWSGTDFALYDANPGEPLDLDYDDLWTTQAGELAWWDGLPDRHLHTLTELRTATHQEQNGLSVTPGFANAAAGDYQLASGSGLIDEGQLIPGLNDDYDGSAPDIGAFESTAAPVPVPGVCGSDNGKTLASAPTAGLCAAGDASAVSGTGPWTWTCHGRNGGTDASCSAARSEPAPPGGGGGGSGGGGCATGGGPLALGLLGLVALLRPRRGAPMGSVPEAAVGRRP